MELYVQFIVAVIILLIIPGPDMAYCIACGMNKGIKGAFYAAIGIGIGGLFLTLITTIIVYFSENISPKFFTYIQILGSIYLLYLGIKILATKANLEQETVAKQDYKNILYRGIIINISNPKALVFFLSFIPQFVPNNAPNPSLIILMLGITLCTLVTSGNIIIGISGVSLSRVAKIILFDRYIEQYVTATIFIVVALASFRYL